jgi:hypothetical protein
MQQPTQTYSRYWLLAILAFNMLSTAIHYCDNYIHFDQYPMPAWITQDAVWISWLVLTVIGGVGYWLYQQQKFWLAYGCLATYAATGASTPGHYFYAPLSHFSAKMNAMIWSDGIVSFALIGFLLWSILMDRPWQTSALSN